MYKLRIISGPNRGESYELKEGEVSVGRQTGNGIVLPSAKVSKRHCVLVVNNDHVHVEDQGSANGIFVNGVKSKKKGLEPGDKISVGEYVLELVKPGNALSWGSTGLPQVQPFGESDLGSVSSAEAKPSPLDSQLPHLHYNPETASPKEKFFYYFENYVMPFFYNLNLKHEWRVISIGILAAFVLISVFISVSPLLDVNHGAVVGQSKIRASYIARQIVDRNAAFIAEDAENRTEIGSLKESRGVRIAMLVRPDLRILAPQEYHNRYLDGPEAEFTKTMANRFASGAETGSAQEVRNGLVVAVEPLKIMNVETGKNEAVAVAVVSIDGRLFTPGLGEMGLVYSNTLIQVSLLALLVALIWYRLTLKRFEVLNEDVDKVLKGAQDKVTRDFKFEEGTQLWDVVQSALQLIPKRGDVEGSKNESKRSARLEDFIDAVKTMGENSRTGIGLFDEARKVEFLNSAFEEITGIRADSAQGNFITMMVRDQAFAVLLEDLFENVRTGVPRSEDFDFSGVAFHLKMAVLGEAEPVGYVLSIHARSETDGG